MSEQLPTDPIDNKAFIVKAEDGVGYAAAEQLENAVVLAGALYVSSTAVQYRPSLSVIEVATGTVQAIIGRPEEPPPVAEVLPEEEA